LAAGLLGGGSRFLGVTEDCALFLNRELTRVGFNDRTPEEWDNVARDVVQAQKDIGKFVPGLGHPVHKQGDPRTPVLMALARENGTFGAHLALFEAIGRSHSDVLGKHLPLNGAGVCGAVLADLGLPLGVMRGVALLARCAGLLGHIVEEQTDPIGVDIYMNVDRNIDYQPPK
jgi:citrate synthase